MRIFTILLIVILLLKNDKALSQTNPFFEYILKSDSLYKNKKYDELCILFTKGKPYQNNEFKYRMYDYYYQASANVKLNKYDTAFDNLNILLKKFNYSDTSIFNDKNFKLLHSDIRWAKFKQSALNNFNQLETQKNKYIDIIKILDSLHTVDQTDVLKLDRNKLLSKSQHEIDSINKKVYNDAKDRAIYVYKLTKEMPWLSKNIIGEKAYEMIFLAAQHSGDKKHIEFLMKKYFKNRQTPMEYAHYAMMYDRLQIMNNKKQRYGSQIIINMSTGKKFYNLIEDLSRIDQYRKYCYYDSLEEDMKWHNIIPFRESTRSELENIK